MKLSKIEAKIIVLLDNLSNENKTYYFIAIKLDISYNHLVQIVRMMVIKKWVKIEYYKSKAGRKAHLMLTETSPIVYAKELLANIDTAK
jgi:hypothetical protein